MARYKWVFHAGDMLYDVGILADGSLHNPNGYPEDVVRAEVLAADARLHERRSRSAQKAAMTRRRRREKHVLEVARRLLAGHGIGARRSCAICGRGLDDPTSINRGVGSECWQDVLQSIQRLREASA